MRGAVFCVAVALSLVLALPVGGQETKPADKRVVKDKYALRPGDVQVELEAFTLTDAPVVELKNASGGKAVDFAKETARAETTVALSKGDYTAEVFLKGPTLDHDTVWVKIGDANSVKAFPSHPRLPMVDFQQSMVGGRTNPATITVAEERKKLAVVITPKETGMMLDRIIFRVKAKPK
jgi:hypothetical protein